MERSLQRYIPDVPLTAVGSNSPGFSFSFFPLSPYDTNAADTGIGPKISQSVLTAAFLFAFKDALYEMTVAARRRSRAIRQ